MTERLSMRQLQYDGEFLIPGLEENHEPLIQGSIHPCITLEPVSTINHSGIQWQGVVVQIWESILFGFRT